MVEVEAVTAVIVQGTSVAAVLDAATRKVSNLSLEKTEETRQKTEVAVEDEEEEEGAEHEAAEFAEDTAVVSVAEEVSAAVAEPSVVVEAVCAEEVVAAEVNWAELKEERAAPNSQHHQICLMKIETSLHLVCFIVN